MDVFFVVAFVVAVLICYWRVGCGLIESQIRGASMIARSPMEFAVYGEEQLVREYRTDMSWTRTWTSFVGVGSIWVALSANTAAEVSGASLLEGLLIATVSLAMVAIPFGYLSWTCFYDYLDVREALKMLSNEAVPASHPDQLL